MVERRAERGQRVTPLELFFDLVFVFAITQVSGFLSRDPTWGGLLRGVLLLGVLWWAWSAYAWLTNILDPEEGAVRLAVLAAVAAMLVVALATPGAFGADAVLFGVAYLIVRLLHLVLFAKAGRGDRELLRAVLRTLPGSIVAPVLLIVAGLVGGTAAQLALWGVALALLYLAPLIGHMRGFRVSPDHFVERFGLIVIIALGESIVAIGVGAAGLPLDAGVIVASLLGFTVSACLWWSYFDWAIYVAQDRLAKATGAARARLARDAYSYLHLPMVGGIVLFAFGLKATLGDEGDPLAIVPALGLCGGIALYFLAHVAFRLRIEGGLGRGRPAATILCLALIPVATVLPALVTLALLAAVCVALIVYEVVRYRESRALIRSRRGGPLGLEELQAGRTEPPEAYPLSFEPSEAEVVGMVGTGSEVVDRLIRATNDHDVEAMMACLRQDYRSEQPLHPEAAFGGREQVGANWSLMFQEVPDLRFDVLHSAIAGDEVWTEVRIHGRKAGGEPFEYRGMAVWGVDHDRVAWARLYFETVEVGGTGIDERMRQVLDTGQDPMET